MKDEIKLLNAIHFGPFNLPYRRRKDIITPIDWLKHYVPCWRIKPF